MTKITDPVSPLIKEAKEKFSARQKQKHATNAILNNHERGLIDTKTAIRQLETNGEGSMAARLRSTIGGG